MATRQVVLLLKSSDRIAHDLCHAFDGCASRRERPPRACLALRKFYNLRPGREFRCFMRNHELVGAREHPQSYESDPYCKLQWRLKLQVEPTPPPLDAVAAPFVAQQEGHAGKALLLLLPLLSSPDNSGAACTHLYMGCEDRCNALFAGAFQLRTVT